ncbi:polysaccharide deacetylase family protein [Solibacillus isronensis]|uniref:polysaccharide deacetylase family protein n=1 Tax=Solibacillus isronensis TaxID=412383 RepID=UPI0009A69740|nr:polysaccharide deacetylase family protein [Solibacillus isronensis]
MRKILYFLLIVFCIVGVSLVNNERVLAAAPSATIKITTIETEVFDETLEQKVITLSKATPVIVLSEADGWAEIQYKTVIGYIPSEYLKSATPQYMLVQAKEEPLVRVTNTQESEIKGKLHLNTIVELYGSATADFVFVKYGRLAGFVNQQALVKPVSKAMIVKGSADLVVREIASSSSTEIGVLRKNSPVKMLTNLKGWAFVTTDKLSGYVLTNGLVTPPVVKEKPVKPVNPKPATDKKIALTFDDGPHPKVTKQILKTLEKYEAKATFFVVGQEVKEHPEILKAVYNAGHEIGNHTFNHEKLTTLSTKEIKQQIQATDSLIKSTIGQRATVFRPPYGSYDESITDQLSVPNVLWTIDTLDWKHRDPEKTVQAVKDRAKNGSIILMHDIHQATADALDEVLATLQKQGYEFVTVSELLGK